MADILSLPALATPGSPMAATPALEKRAHEVAEQFEAQFVSIMMGFMFESLPTDGPFGGGAGEAAFRPMLVDEYGKIIAKTGGMGISDIIAREIIRLQTGEVAPLPGSPAAAAAAAKADTEAGTPPKPDLKGPMP